MTTGAAPGSGPAPARTPVPDPRFSVANMDQAADPRVDFYAYAAGRWIRENPIPGDKWGWNTFIEVSERNHELVRTILEGCRGAVGASQDPVERLVGRFYASAMDTERIEALGLEPIRGDLARIDAIGSVEELLREIARSHRQGTDAAFQPYVYPDEKASERYAYYLHQGGLSLPDREYYDQSKFASQREAFRAHLVAAFRSLGEDPEPAQRSATRVFDVETALAAASRTRTELRDAERNYHKLSVEEASARWSHTPWRAYLEAAGIPSVGEIIVGQPEFFDAIDRLFAVRALEDWKAYLRFHCLHASAPFLSASVERADFELFERTLRGQPEQEPRWLRAQRVLDGAIGEAVGALYVARHFPREAREGMGALVEDLVAVFRGRLERLAWMTPDTRRRALEKFGRFQAKIGHPERFRDYSSIRVEPDDYLGNVRRAAEFEHDRQVRRVGAPVDRTEWGMTPTQVNAYFDRTKNEIVFPAAILQPPFFDPAADDAVNYGGIGAVIAHEITHGFDDQGRKYDASGNLSDWWTEADAREFRSRADRVVQQYGGFEGLPGQPVNGELTLGENIADLGGVSIALEALERRLSNDPTRRKLVDGLTPEQRFFVAWAQVWKENVREEARKMRLTIDPHSPGRPRAIGPIVNLDAFAEAFSLREGEPMWRPPAERTAIW